MSTDDMPSAFQELKRSDPWVEISHAARMTYRRESTLQGWIKKGYIRSLNTGRLTWLSRDDVVYCAEKVRSGKKHSLLTLVQRGIAPLEGEGLTGGQIYEWAQRVHYEALLLPAPVEPELPSESRGEIEHLKEEMRAIKSLLSQVIGQSQLPSRLPSFNDQTSEEFLRDIHSALAREHWTLKDVQKYLRVLGGMAHPHYEALESWANSRPELAQELCGRGMPAHAPVLRLAFKLKQHTQSGGVRTGPVMAELETQARTVYRHVEERCLERMVLLRAQTGSRLAIGATTTDQWVLSRLL